MTAYATGDVVRVKGTAGLVICNRLDDTVIVTDMDATVVGAFDPAEAEFWYGYDSIDAAELRQQLLAVLDAPDRDPTYVHVDAWVRESMTDLVGLTIEMRTP